MPGSDPSRRKEIYILGLILLLALVHGLAYVFIIPPWQHYDEPNHFERAWLTAHLNKNPGRDEFDAAMSRATVESMVANKFFVGMGDLPDLSAGKEVRIPGYTQYDEPPLYYWLASLPLRLMGEVGIDAQLYTMRLVSLLCYLITIVAAWGAGRELTRPGSPARWMAPVTLALLPGFTDVMTSVNSDVAAVVLFLLFFWGSARLLKRGFSLLAFLGVVLAAGLAYFTKNTAMVAVAVLPVVLLFTFLRGKLRWIGWAFLIAVVVIGLGLSLRWDDAFYWFRAFAQPEPTRMQSDQAVLGDYVLRFDSWNRATPGWIPPIFQLVPVKVAQGLAGKDVTLGVWMWASQPVETQLPALWVGAESFSKPVQLSRSPTFFALNVKVPAPSGRMWVSLKMDELREQHIQIFFDGFILAEGTRPEAVPPTFTAPDGLQGEWGGQAFTNLLRNPSIEQAGPRFAPRVDALAGQVLPNDTRLSMILSSILDWSSTGAVYGVAGKHLFRTFWAKFGWGHIDLLGAQWVGGGPYALLALILLLGGIGAFIGAIRRRKAIDWEIAFVIILSLAAAWGMALARITIHLAYWHLYVPAARHAYPVIVPTVLALCFGWLELLRGLNALRRRMIARGGRMGAILSSVRCSLPPKLDDFRFQFIAYTAFFIVLDVWSIVSVLVYFGNK